jgi:hypothetical protein
MICPGCGPASGFAPADIPEVAEPAEPPDDPVPAPTVLLPDAPVPEPMPVSPEAVVPDAPPVPPGCMAGDPEVVEPEPVAAGRSDEGAVVPCAKADAVTRAVAIRQAVMCVLSIDVSLMGGMGSPRPKTRNVHAAMRPAERDCRKWARRPRLSLAYQQQFFAIVPGNDRVPWVAAQACQRHMAEPAGSARRFHDDAVS